MAKKKSSLAKNKKVLALKDRFNQWKQTAHEVIMSPVRFMKFVFMVTGAFTWFMIFLTFFSIISFFNSMPDLDKMSFKDVQNMAIKRVSKRFENKKKGKYYRWTKGHDISRYLLHAVVMSEDGNFFDHEGVDYNAIINSLARNLRKREYSAGGSTITQQVVKNVFLTHEKSIVRKLKEYFIAKRLEARFSKNKILELYLNVAEFGPDIYGVYHASKVYFKKTPSKINAAEGAFLALMLPSPRRNYLSVYKNKYLSSKNKKKLRRVLRDLLHMEYISPKQYKKFSKYKYFK
jgi:monofunctional biosynthetic peptidoglycan transglycosylase